MFIKKAKFQTSIFWQEHAVTVKKMKEKLTSEHYNDEIKKISRKKVIIIYAIYLSSILLQKRV